MANRRKVNADAALSISEAAEYLCKNLQSRIDQQQARIAALELSEKDAMRRIDELGRLAEAQQNELTDLRAGIRLLCRQIEQLGGKPVWRPGNSQGIPAQVE